MRKVSTQPDPRPHPFLLSADVDRYPSYGFDWMNSGRPCAAQLGRLGVYDLAARQEAYPIKKTVRSGSASQSVDFFVTQIIKCGSEINVFVFETVNFAS